MVKTHLIMVPCHGIWDSKVYSSANPKPAKAGEAVNEWHLASFQIPTKDNISFIEHAKIAIDEFKKDKDNSVLVFSGGFTKAGVEQSESRSYFELSRALGLLDTEDEHAGVECEEYARDSYENVLFSLLKFRKTTGSFPTKYTIVGFEFKRHRFIEQHLKVLQFTNVNYLTYGPVFPDDYDYSGYSSVQEAQDAFFKDLEGSEDRFAVQPFNEFRFGQGGSVLKKRLSRDPYSRGLEDYFTGVTAGDGILKTLLHIGESPDSERVYESEVENKFPWIQ
ncbi:unnamed protein product [Kuraishia capsulata CBS 1993]|uniref:DUF218 domain-containing protein n=1 Tax=Kuraishia capsulata CBS 1993 TaxID=1382522 RepID=W6MUM7_9ASCO|nr:uncharacterized protein KUCA_T00001735001 [Kuraishia capsulata CBS 1993]CDK25765.1 unnamed protein product [Kuraishia capsulata CBS 1993]